MNRTEIVRNNLFVGYGHSCGTTEFRVKHLKRKENLSDFDINFTFIASKTILCGWCFNTVITPWLKLRIVRGDAISHIAIS